MPEKVWWVMAVFGSISLNLIMMIYFQLNKLAMGEMDAMSDNISTGLLSFIMLLMIAAHIVGSHIFFYIYLEKIEDYLCDIEMFSLNRAVCGDSIFGRRMRETFVMLVVVAPEIFWRQERIPRQKLLKLPRRLLWGVRIIYGSMILIGVSSGLLYYLRAPH